MSPTELYVKTPQGASAEWRFTNIGTVPASQHYGKLTKRHCASQKLTMTGYVTKQAATAACTLRGDCAGVYLVHCDPKATYYLCKAATWPISHSDSCIFEKSTAVVPVVPSPTPPTSCTSIFDSTYGNILTCAHQDYFCNKDSKCALCNAGCFEGLSIFLYTDFLPSLYQT